MKNRRIQQAFVLLITLLFATSVNGQDIQIHPIYITDTVPQISIDTAFHPARYKPAFIKPDNTSTIEAGKSDLSTLETNKLFQDNKSFDKMLKACIDTDYESALNHIEKMSGKNLSPDQVGILNDWKLFCLRKSNKYDEIINMFAGGNVNLYYPANYAWAGYAFWYKERYIEAGVYYEKAKILMGTSVDKAFLYTAGLSSFSLGNYDKANEYLDKYVAAGGNDTSAFYYLGTVDFNQGKYEKAVAQLNKYSERGGAYDAAFYYLGIASYNTAKFEKCASYFDIYLQLKGKDPEALYDMGLANYKLGLFDSAVSDFNRYISRGGKNQSALLFSGYSSFLQFYKNKGAFDKLDDAIKYYTRYIAGLDAAKNNNRPGLYLNRATAKIYKQDFQGAIADYDLQIKFTPGDIRPYELKANCYERMKNISGAIDATEAAMKSFRDNSALYNLHAWYKALNSSYGSALQDAEKAIALDNKNAMAWNTKGYILMKQNKNDEAITWFDKALSLEPVPIANTYYYRGIAKQQMNDIPGACNDWTKALEIKFFMDPLITNADVEKLKGGYCK